jgi:hypothetical protein
MNKKNIICLSLLSIGFALLTSCYSDKEEVLYPKGCDTDTISVISYSIHVEPIVINQCYACHNNVNNASIGGNIKLEGHTNFTLAIQNNNVLGSIKREPGVSPMPKNAPKLSECSIRLIEKWVNQGALNN